MMVPKCLGESRPHVSCLFSFIFACLMEVVRVPGQFLPLVCELCCSTAVAARCWELEAGWSFKCNYGEVNRVAPEWRTMQLVGWMHAVRSVFIVEVYLTHLFFCDHMVLVLLFLIKTKHSRLTDWIIEKGRDNRATKIRRLIDKLSTFKWINN